MAECHLTIEKIKPEFLPQIYEIEKSSFSRPYAHSLIRMLAIEHPETFLVARIEQKIVGYAVASANEHSGHLFSIAVHRDFRRKGIGKRLMEEIIFELKSLGVRTLTLEVRVSNADASQFYRKIGFLAVGEAKAYYENGENAIVYFKAVH